MILLIGDYVHIKHYTNLTLFIIAITLIMVNMGYSQYWFQTGAKSSYTAEFNNGSSSYIQTIYQNAPKHGSFAYWVGESLKNGAFIQIGYEIPNMSGEYANDCSPSGCSGVVNLTAGIPAWFWEYFPANYSGNNFYGDIGPSGSVGDNGTFNEYGFRALGNVWYLFLNNIKIGSVMLNSTTSGGYPPVAFAEYADALNNSSTMIPVKFKNFSFYNQTIVKKVAEAYSYIGYGKNSETSMNNPYGVIEVANTLDYFESGSSLPMYKNNTLLWNIGYYLNTYSDYGNLSQSSQYLAYSTTTISAPQYIYIGKYQRAAFANWSGNGYGSYTGSNNTAIISINGNVSEFAHWKTQYYVNVSTEIGNASGSGWYDNNSTANIDINKNTYYLNNSERFLFEGWNGANHNQSINITVRSPLIFNAMWVKQYYVNVSTEIGNASGSGWYDNNSVDNISIKNPYKYINESVRDGFIGWSNISYNTTDTYITVKSPLKIHAIYATEHIAKIISENVYNNFIYPDYYKTNIGNINGTPYIPLNKNIFVYSAYYNGVNILINKTLNAQKNYTFILKLPVYNVSIKTVDYLFMPVNASLNLTFKNGTKLFMYTGKEGIVNFNNVLLNSINGSASYNGKLIYISTANGSVTLFFLDGYSAVAITAIIIFILFLIVDKLIKRKKHPWHQKLHSR